MYVYYLTFVRIFHLFWWIQFNQKVAGRDHAIEREEKSMHDARGGRREEGGRRAWSSGQTTDPAGKYGVGLLYLLLRAPIAWVGTIRRESTREERAEIFSR